MTKIEQFMLDIQYIDSVFKPLVPKSVSKPKKKKVTTGITGGYLTADEYFKVASSPTGWTLGTPAIFRKSATTTDLGDWQPYTSISSS